MRYRFKDAMGDVLGERDFDEHEVARVWAMDNDELEDEVQRVEYQDATGEWRWAGALVG